MRIKELNLIGFGKFTNKRIPLKDGINIIYGENEAGKTTLHSFIDGMFYGFLKPYVSRTIYLDSHEKYKPWSGVKYSGTIKFEYDGSDYTIERDFTKGSESTSVLIDTTGENIINDIDTGDKGRIFQPGYHFFGFSDAVFSNTVSIKQLGSKTDDNLANELRDRLTNTSTSLDENLSVDKAIEELNKSLKEIGSSRAPTSNYGKTMIELEELTIERERVSTYKDEYNEILEYSSRLDTKLLESQESMGILKESLEEAVITDKNNIYKKSLEIIDKINGLEEKEKEYEKFKNISVDSYTEGIRLKDRMENLGNRKLELKNDLLKVKNILKQYDNSEPNSEIDSNLELDYLKFEELEEEKNKTLISASDNRSEFLKRDYESGTGKIKTYNISLILSLFFALGISGFGLIKSSYPIILSSLIFIFIAVFNIIKARGLKANVHSIKEKYMESLEYTNKLNKEIQNIEDEQKHILKKHNVNSKIEFKKIYGEKQLDIFKMRESKSILEENKNKEELFVKEIKHIGSQIENSNLSLEKILKENLSSNLKELKESINNKEIYKSLIDEIKTNKLILEKTLGNHSMDELSKDLFNFAKDINSIEIKQSSESLKAQIEEKQNTINDLKIEARGIKERLDILNREVGKLVEIDEEIVRKNNLISNLDKKRASLELAKETIEGLAKDIHKQFAPEINEKVGTIIKSITNGKYESVKLDDKLNLGIINPDDNQLIDITSLSGGTIDQLYLSLRFGIIDSIGDKQPPLILDDCFIQYDNNRLANIMEYLSGLDRNRQIILFTCHKREFEILKENNKDFNLINL